MGLRSNIQGGEIEAEYVDTNERDGTITTVMWMGETDVVAHNGLTGHLLMR